MVTSLTTSASTSARTIPRWKMASRSTLSISPWTTWRKPFHIGEFVVTRGRCCDDYLGSFLGHQLVQERCHDLMAVGKLYTRQYFRGSDHVRHNNEFTVKRRWRSMLFHEARVGGAMRIEGTYMNIESVVYAGPPCCLRASFRASVSF